MRAGAALVAIGVATLVRTGVDSPLNEPVEPVLGWDHTPMLGIIEIVGGALLVVFAVRPGGRWLVGIIGAALLVGGGMILAEMDWTVEQLGAEESFGWVLVAAGAVAVLASVVTPRRYQRVTGIPVTEQPSGHSEPHLAATAATAAIGESWYGRLAMARARLPRGTRSGVSCLRLHVPIDAGGGVVGDESACCVGPRRR